MHLVRWGSRMVLDLFFYAIRTGRWWVPLLIIVLLLAPVLAATTKVVVPVATYTLF